MGPARLFSAALLLASLAASGAQVPAGEKAADLSTVISAADNVQGQPLTLERAVAEALARNFSVTIQQYAVDSAAAAVAIAQSTYDPVLGVTWNKNVSQAPIVSELNVGVGGVTAAATNEQETQVSVTQNVITGGQVTAGYSLARDATNSIYSILNPEYAGTASLTLTQPLLQGAGTDYARAVIESARLGKTIASLTFKSTVLTMVYNVETAYFNLIYARDQYAVAQDSLKLAQQLLDENTIKRRTGVLTDLDVVQAQAGVATAKSQLIGFRQAMDNAEDALLQAMGEREFKLKVGPVAFPEPMPGTDVSFDLTYKLARDNGPSLATVQAVIDQYKLAALRAKRNDLPELNALLGGGYSSVQNSYANANARLWNGSGYNWTAGLALTFPWGLRENKALYRQAMDNVKSEQVTLDQSDQTLVINVRAAVRAVQANVEALSAASEATVLSQKQYDLQKAKFDAGLATSYDVLQAQDQLESARVTELQSKVSLRIAVAEVHFLEGSSLDSYHISLK